MNGKWIFITILFILIVAMFYPFDLTMATRRNLHILNQMGTPIAGTMVRQIWYQYPLDIHGEEDFVVSLSGKISLPRRVVRTNILYILIGAFNEFRKYSIHASYCSRESVGVFARDYRDEWFYNGKGIESGVIVLTKGESGHFK